MFRVITGMLTHAHTHQPPPPPKNKKNPTEQKAEEFSVSTWGRVIATFILQLAKTGHNPMWWDEAERMVEHTVSIGNTF